MIKLSVIIATWNSERFIGDCLKSLGGLRSTAADVLVVDNASADKTVEIVRERFPWVTLIENKTNLGFAKANNMGIQAASGEYVCLINPDVVVLQGCIQEMLRFMEGNPSVALLGPQMIGTDGTVVRSCMKFPTLWNCLCDAIVLNRLFPKSSILGGQMMRDCSWDQVQEVDVLNGWFVLIRRSALDHVGLLDEGFFMYGEDVDWCSRFRQAHWRLVYYPPAKAIHYGGGSSARQPIRFYVEMQRANLLYWKKHKSSFAQAGFVVIVGIYHLLRVAGYGVLYFARRRRSLEAAYKIKRSTACLRWLMTLTAGTEAK